MSDFVEAVVEATGQKQRIPVAWLEHPVLSRGFRKTARANRVSRQAEAPAPVEATGPTEAKPAQKKEN